MGKEECQLLMAVDTFTILYENVFLNLYIRLKNCKISVNLSCFLQILLVFKVFYLFFDLSKDVIKG